MLPLKPILYGLIAALLLLGFYFLILNFVSGWGFTLKQFDDNWYYVILLSSGFGIQVGLYTYIKQYSSSEAKRSREVLNGDSSLRLSPDRTIENDGRVVAVSGTTSTVAMISCCSHYLVNILPILGITGLVTFVSQYQTELFWVGIASNLAGIVYMISKVLKIRTLVPPPR
ncbi:MAG: hypothetical protein Q7K55_05000 [Candidatus Levybacteria bacterium]|nr:hypothetical protein [Candidatus Levybacteria bacterium]